MLTSKFGHPRRKNNQNNFVAFLSYYLVLREILRRVGVAVDKKFWHRPRCWCILQSKPCDPLSFCLSFGIYGRAGFCRCASGEQGRWLSCDGLMSIAVLYIVHIVCDTWKKQSKADRNHSGLIWGLLRRAICPFPARDNPKEWIL